MGKRLLKLPRRFFGYQASSVDQLVADRDSMLGVAEQRVRSAEARIAELEEELSRRQEDIEAVKSHIDPDQALVEARPDDPPAPLPPLPAVDHALREADDKADDSEDIEEIEEWPLPLIQARTVEFIPPPEPSADFDPMPIGGEDRDWSSQPAESWGSEPLVASAVDEPAAWGEVLDEPNDSAESIDSEASPEHHEAATAERIVTPQITPAYMSEELASVVKAAEESATKIIERAWESTRTQISQVDRLWREVQEEIIRFAAWRQHVDPMISTVQSYIEEARERIEEVPPRIQEALSPAVEAMARVDEGMGEFAKASDLPELLGRLHAEVAKGIDAGDFTASTSETPATADRAFDVPEEGSEAEVQAAADEVSDHGEAEVSEESPLEAGQNDQVHSNGGPREQGGDDIEMARAIAHELRIINEAGDAVTTPDNT